MLYASCYIDTLVKSVDGKCSAPAFLGGNSKGVNSQRVNCESTGGQSANKPVNPGQSVEQGESAVRTSNVKSCVSNNINGLARHNNDNCGSEEVYTTMAIGSGDNVENNSTYLLSDAEFKALKNGDERVFKTVYMAYFDLLIYVVRRCGAPDDSSQDIVQDAFIKLYDKRDQIRDASAVKSWLVTTARNLTIDRLRRNQLEKNKLSEQQQSASDSLAVPEQHLLPTNLLHELELVLVKDLIDQVVNETGEDSFRLFYRDGLSAKAIAKQKGESVGTVTSRISRQRKQFHETFVRALTKLREAVV